MRRVVVTGIGLITCLGKGRDSLIDAIMEGRSGISDVTLFPTAGYRACMGGQIKHVPIEENNRGRTFLKHAVDEALDDAGVTTMDRLELFIGTIHGSLDLWEQSCLSNFTDVRAMESIPSWKIHEGLFGNRAESVKVYTISSTCTSATSAAGLALYTIRAGRSDFALVAGVEVLTSFVYAGFSSLNALSPTLCRPFDKDRDGLVLGEGSAVLAFEEFERARRRGANIYGELAGFSMSTDGKYLTAPDPTGKGLAQCIESALKNSGVGQDSIDYLSLHGVGTVPSDRMECVAVRKVFGAGAAKIPASSIKPMIGQTNGAGGAIEAATCLLCMKHGIIPATLNHREPEAEFRAFDFVANEPREKKVKASLSVNNAFCGGNTALVFRSV